MKISKALKRVLEAAHKEVSKWEPWQRSLDPYGEKNKSEQRNTPRVK
jgi:hypothetical protein